MATYTVHEPPQSPADRLDRAESLVFVKDGFVWSAFLLTPLWAIAHRLWLVLIGYIVVELALALALQQLALADKPAGSALMLALQVICGLEASTLHRWTLRRNGWSMLGSVNGRNEWDCERRFFDLWLPAQPLIRADALSPSPALQATTTASPPQPAPIGGGGWRSAFRWRRGNGG